MSGARPAWIETLCRSEKLPADYADAALRFVGPVAAAVAGLRRRRDRPVVAGVSGAQGSGKSTFTLFLESWLRHEFSLSAVTLPLDDLYLTRGERGALAREVHPLLATRGVPGTHDTGLGLRIIGDLTAAAAAGLVAVPVFDKAADDRLPRPKWRQVEAPADVVILEGWCVGARAQRNDDLQKPVNALEATEDADGRWRRYVNERLRGDYAELFGTIDLLIMLRVPSFDRVFEWRLLQEQKLRERLKSRGDSGDSGGGQTETELQRFIRHYERLTRHMLATMPAYADAVIEIDDEHRLVRVKGL